MKNQIQKKQSVTSMLKALSVLICFVFLDYAAYANSRIKDIADFEGVRDNILVGYGLVIGLNGTGDKLNSAVFTRESFIAMLERLGVNARDKSLNSKNIAAVMVTATLNPFSRQGTRVTVQVSTIGDATDLRGGTLVATPLKGADNEVYAVGQGPVIVSGFQAIGEAASIVKGHPTAGLIPNGAIVEREIPFELNTQSSIRIYLRNPDFTTAQRVTHAVNTSFLHNPQIKSPIARLIDKATIEMEVPPYYKDQTSLLLTKVEQLSITPDMAAKILIDKSSGVVVMGENVRIRPVAIAQGNISIKIVETPMVSQPNSLSEGETVVVPRTNVTIEEGNKKLTLLKSAPTIGDLVRNLNALGVTVPELMDIINAIHRMGAIQASLEVV
ncbi:MAG: flagellar basal body P-ring protein FlgI [Alphaproteobacteria bacterium]|nr:flagellar basal body P-ring protein FlgI [Alphaproteobacteria bacterium]